MDAVGDEALTEEARCAILKKTDTDWSWEDAQDYLLMFGATQKGKRRISAAWFAVPLGRNLRIFSETARRNMPHRGLSCFWLWENRFLRPFFLVTEGKPCL
jgi:hypothetical protein